MHPVLQTHCIAMKFQGFQELRQNRTIDSYGAWIIAMEPENFEFPPLSDLGPEVQGRNVVSLRDLIDLRDEAERLKAWSWSFTTFDHQDMIVDISQRNIGAQFVLASHIRAGNDCLFNASPEDQ